MHSPPLLQSTSLLWSLSLKSAAPLPLSLSSQPSRTQSSHLSFSVGSGWFCGVLPAPYRTKDGVQIPALPLPSYRQAISTTGAAVSHREAGWGELHTSYPGAEVESGGRR